MGDPAASSVLPGTHPVVFLCGSKSTCPSSFLLSCWDSSVPLHTRSCERAVGTPVAPLCSLSQEAAGSCGSSVQLRLLIRGVQRDGGCRRGNAQSQVNLPRVTKVTASQLLRCYRSSWGSPLVLSTQCRCLQQLQQLFNLCIKLSSKPKSTLKRDNMDYVV